MAKEFKLQFELENSAFDFGIEEEIVKILKEIQIQVLNGHSSRVIMDTSGNCIGKWNINE